MNAFPGVDAGTISVEQPDTCHRVIAEIESARDISVELQSIGWTEFSNIGWSSPLPGMCAVTPQGYTYRDSDRWTSLADYLPPPLTARALVTSCNNCLELAGSICRDKAVAGKGGADNDTAKLRMNSWKQLEDALAAAEFSARNRATLVKSSVFSPVEAHFRSTDEGIRQLFYPSFKNKSARFLELHSSLADKLGAARQIVSLLTRSGLTGSTEGEADGGP
jgi:hypothetical protein